MKLRLLRHAKSDWSDESLSDHERPLNGRGRKAAFAMGKALSSRGEAQSVHVSSARRAQMTLAGVSESWPELSSLRHTTDADLYTFSASALVHWLRATEGSEPLFLIGHNPAFTDLINWCVGQQIMDNLPTAGFAELQIDKSAWSELEPGCAELIYKLFPRELTDD